MLYIYISCIYIYYTHYICDYKYYIYIIHTYMHACMHACIQTDRHRHRHRHRQRQTDRQTDIQTYIHTDIHTYIYIYIHIILKHIEFWCLIDFFHCRFGVAEGLRNFSRLVCKGEAWFARCLRCYAPINLQSQRLSCQKPLRYESEIDKDMIDIRANLGIRIRSICIAGIHFPKIYPEVP